MKLWTIGHSGRTAEEFFGLLAGEPDIEQVVDVRLRPAGQLNGFARQKDLGYLLDRLADKQYCWKPLLAPPPALLKRYRDGWFGWDGYARRYVDGLHDVDVAMAIDPADLAGACLMCSEHDPHQCHRRLAAEYLRDAWRELWDVELEIIHL